MQTHYTFDPIHFRLNRIKRVSVMLFLICSFFIASPIIIFYTMGFRYDLKSGIVRTTGVISANIEPRDAQVYINGSYIHGKMPLRLSNRAPGAYKIRIEKQGYKTWEKEINVTSNQTTYINSFELLRDAAPLPVELPESMLELHSLPVSESITGLSRISEAGTSSYRLFVFDPKKQSFEIARDIKIRPSISLSPFHATGLILEKDKLKNSLELFDTKNFERRTNISVSSTDLQNYQWSKKAGELYIRADEKIERVDLRGERRQIGSVSSSISLWYMEYPETLWAIKKATLFLEQKPGIAYSIPGDTEKILDINKDRILLKTKSGITVINRNEKDNAVTNMSTQSWYYNHETEEWWTWSDWELYSIYKNGSVRLLSREGKKIEGALPLGNKGMKLLIHEEGADAFNPGIFPLQNMILAPNVDQIFAIPKYKMLYFTTSENDIRKMFKLPY